MSLIKIDFQTFVTRMASVATIVATIFVFSEFGFAQPPLQEAEKTETSQPKTNAEQQQQTEQKPTQKTPKKKPKKGQIEIPAPAELSLETKDKVILKCTFFAAPQDGEGSGKTALPFILVHDWEGSRADLLPFAEYLQKQGCAVIVPDLRGHGGSTAVTGVSKELDYNKFRKSELASVWNDLEKCKQYLMERNDAGELNIDLLNVVAVGKSASFALEWSIRDWSWPPQAGIKQGQDVKSVTLIAPRKKIKGISAMPLLKHPIFSGRQSANMPTLVVWSSNDSEAAEDSESITDYMKKGRPDVEEIEDAEEKKKVQSLYSFAIPRSRMTGTELIRDNQVQGFWQTIANFVSTQVGAKQDDFRWQVRKRD